MIIASAESLLISALVNSEDARGAVNFGITPDHFRGYKDEYNWLLNYVERYDDQPSKAIFLSEFRSFPMDQHYDIRSAVDQVFKAWAKHRITEATAESFDLLSVGNVQGAYERLVAAKPMVTSPKPKRLLTDLSFFDSWENDTRGVDVPYTLLQRHTQGIKPGNLWYLAARPGNGKTAHLCNIATAAVLAGARVLFYSLEMSEMEVRARFHAALATHFGWQGITMQDIRDRRVDMGNYKSFIQYLDEPGRLGTLDIHTPRNGPVSPSTVAARAGEYQLNIIDYITLMRSDTGSSAVEDWRIAAVISNRLKEIALSEDTGVVCASQINRDGESEKAPPKVKNLAQSDALGQDGDVVVTMMKGPHDSYTRFSLEKNRHGMTGVQFYSTFEPNTGVYRSIDKFAAEELAITAEERG